MKIKAVTLLFEGNEKTAFARINTEFLVDTEKGSNLGEAMDDLIEQIANKSYEQAEAEYDAAD